MQSLLNRSVQVGVMHSAKRSEFILKGFLLCSHCAHKLCASWSKGKLGKKYPYYHCNRCSNSQRASLAETHKAFETLLEQVRVLPEYFASLREAISEHVSGAAKAAAEVRRSQRAALSRMEADGGGGGAIADAGD